MKVELLVELLIPDTTAITAFHTLERTGFKELKELKRADYYLFDVEGDFSDFSEKIKNVDILVNANKHKALVKKADDKFENGKTRVIIKNVDNPGEGVLSTLKNRLGLKNIASLEKGVMWIMDIDAEDKEKIAEKITKELLMNEHYQDFKIV